jgi:hypothetical protein
VQCRACHYNHCKIRVKKHIKCCIKFLKFVEFCVEIIECSSSSSNCRVSSDVVANHDSHETAVDTLSFFSQCLKRTAITILNHCLKPAEQHMGTNMV